MSFSRDLGFLDTDEIAGMAKMATVTGNAVPEKDVELVPIAIAAAKAAVDAFGGHAHVFIAGNFRKLPDPADAAEMENYQQKSITITVTTHTKADGTHR